MIKNISSYMFQLFEDWGDIPEAEFEPGDDARYTGVYLALGEYEPSIKWMKSFAVMTNHTVSWRFKCTAISTSDYRGEVLSYRLWVARRQRDWRADHVPDTRE